MDQRAARFDVVYREHYRAIYAYVYRRLPERAGEVADVVADVFLVVWRRFDEVPAGDEQRLWIFGIARRTVPGAQRTARRRTNLIRRLTDLARVRPSGGEDSAQRLDVQAAIARLRAQDREVLSLVLWDGLTHAEAAVVLGCSANAVTQRLRAARHRFEAELGFPAATPDLTVRT